MRLQIPLYKLFLIVAVWAVVLGGYSSLGAIGLVIAAVIGTAGSGIVVVIHEKREVVESLNVAFGSTVGAFLANLLLVSPVINHYGSIDLLRDWIVMSIGAIVGGVIASRTRKK